MKILILGGTKFLGRHLTTAALVRGHEVALFNRGRHSDEKFENVEQLRGDRHADLNKLAGRRFDAVIDTCGYLPQTVEASAQFLKDAVDRYVFISSISAYKDFCRPDFDETAPVAELTAAQEVEFQQIDPQAELTGPVLGAMYGALKVLCERAAERALPNRVLNVRAGLIVGPFDPTDRFTYWVARVANGGEVLAPGKPDRFVQLIDARDLAEWIVRMTERRATGTFHAAGRPFALTMEKMLEEIKSATAGDAQFIWADEEFLKRENVRAWSEMPLYLDESNAAWSGFLSANVDKALENGLRFRPLRETIRETLNWRKTKSDEMKAGISAARENELLRKRREQ